MGPSHYFLCLQEAKNVEQIFNIPPYSNHLWNYIESIMKISNSDISSIPHTINNWRDESFNSPILKKTQNVILDLFLWVIWKERNYHIFNNHSPPHDSLWITIKNNVKEINSMQCQSDQDWYISFSQEALLLQSQFSTPGVMISPSLHPATTPIPSCQSPLPLNFLKLNVDGDSKGSPYKVRYRGSFRDNFGSPIYIYSRFMGYNGNKVAHLKAL